MYFKGNKINEMPVKRIDLDKIIDRSSGGDAFVGQLALKSS